MSECVARKEGFSQVCIAQGLLISSGEELEAKIMEVFGVRAQYLETIYTRPDLQRGWVEMEGTGGRADVFFAVHNEDIGKFAVPRLQFGIRWIEDAISQVNGGNKIYPERVEQYKTW